MTADVVDITTKDRLNALEDAMARMQMEHDQAQTKFLVMMSLLQEVAQQMDSVAKSLQRYEEEELRARNERPSE